MQTCPDCKGKSQKYLHLHYAKGKGRSGWYWKDCWRCNGTKEVSDEVLAAINLSDTLNAVMKEKNLDAFSEVVGVTNAELTEARLGRLTVGRISEIIAIIKGN